MSPNSLISIFILAVGLAQCQVQKLRFCATRSEFSLCLKMEEEIDLVQCISRPDRLSCMEALEADEADTLNLDAANLFVAGNHFNLSILAFEQNNGEPYKYRSVALVPKSLELSSLNDLRGKRSCHTGVGRTAGWQIPITYLQRSGIMSQDCRGELETVENFFSESCAPGKWSKDPIIDAELKRKHPSLCSRCGDPEKCSRSDIYSGYEGALACLKDGKGDVSFSKTEAVEKYLQDNPTFADGYEFLCPDNTRRSLRNGADLSCSWGVRPSNAFVFSSHKTQEQKGELYSIIRQIFSRYSSNIPQIQRQQKPEWFTKLFVSSVNVTDILRATSLHQSPSLYLGDFRYTMDRSLGECRPTTVRFCTTSEQGINKCNDLGKVALSRRMDTSIGCILESTTADCITAVKEGRADVITLDGGDVYRAGKYSELVPIASELYGEVDATYFAVAVIPADSEINQPEDLRGKRSCHTGIGRTAGWVMPVGFFINSTLIPKDQCDRTAAVADLFTASCAPGANDAKYNPTGSGAVKLCQQCIGDVNGDHKCSRSAEERYSGYAGAFRCLSENNGDISFVKHTTVSEYTDGKSDLDWAKELKSSNYKLLCKNGGTDDIENYQTCNLGKVPSHQVMISGSSTFDRRLQLATKIAEINKWFGLLSPNFDIFKSYGNKADLLFKDSTTELRAVPLHATYRDVLGDDYLNAVEAADPLLCVQDA